MAVGKYTQAELYEMVEGQVHQKFTQVNDQQVTVNRAVRFVLGDLDLRSTKRNSQLAPNLFRDIYNYTAPSDLKQHKIIDIRKQVNRLSSEGWILVDETDFNRYKEVSDYRIAVADDDLVRMLKIDGVEGSVKTTLHNCDSLTANGTWAATADASNLTADTDNYISGGASLNFDMAAGGTTGYIENSDMTALSMAKHEDMASVFAWVYIPDYSDAEADTVTNFILRIGSSSANYDSVTVTTNNEGTTFYDGWNLLRFDLNGATSTGTPDYTAINYLRLTVTKSASLAADTDWRVDSITSQIGDIYNVVYYSKYGWQSSAGAFLEESTATTDALNADTDEVELIAVKAAELVAQELKEMDDFKIFRQQYAEMKAQYESQSPSEALRIHRTYYDAPVISRGRGWGRMKS